MTKDSANNEKPCLDVLRLGATEVETINRDLDQFGGEDADPEHRNEKSFPYRRSIKLVVTVYQPGGNTARFLTVPRNLSRSGVSVLHGGFIYPGTKVTIVLETLNRKNVNVPGETIRCKLVRGRAHLIGIRFNEMIDLSQFIFNSNEDGWAQHLPKLAGRIACVEGEASDRQILRCLLDRLGVQNESCDGAADLIEQMHKQNFDLIFVDIDRNEKFAEVLEKVRQSAVGLPVVAVTAEESDDLNGRLLQQHGCNGTLAKPLDASVVAQLLLQYLPLADENHADAGSSRVIHSRLWGDLSMRDLICTYLDQLESQVKALEKQFAVKPDRAMTIRICLQIRGASGSYGFPQISAAATDLRNMAETDEPPDALRCKLAELGNLASAACLAREEHRKPADPPADASAAPAADATKTDNKKTPPDAKAA